MHNEFIMENPTKMDLFGGTTILGNLTPFQIPRKVRIPLPSGICMYLSHSYWNSRNSGFTPSKWIFPSFFLNVYPGQPRDPQPQLSSCHARACHAGGSTRRSSSRPPQIGRWSSGTTRIASPSSPSTCHRPPGGSWWILVNRVKGWNEMITGKGETTWGL